MLRIACLWCSRLLLLLLLLLLLVVFRAASKIALHFGRRLVWSRACAQWVVSFQMLQLWLLRFRGQATWLLLLLLPHRSARKRRMRYGH